MALPALLLLLLPLLEGEALGEPRAETPEELLVLTVATEATEGYERLLRSAQRFNYSLRTLGLGRAWRGGDVAHTVGGGQKVRWLKKAVAPLRNRTGLVLLFVDSYDVVFAGGPQELLAKFGGLGGRVLFSAEAFCWPREDLASSYPSPPRGGKPFLNSGGFMGFAPSLWRLVERWRHRDDDDDQLFYTHLYLHPSLREELGLILDHHSQIFQNLNGALDEVVLKFEGGGARVRNVAHDTLPVVIHGNGPTKLQLNYLSNYVPGGWSPQGCGDCDWGVRDPPGDKDPIPGILVGIFVEKPTPFLDQFLQRLLNWELPPARISLFLHNSEHLHSSLLRSRWPRLLRKFGGNGTFLGPQHRLGEGPARDMGMSLCREDPGCHFYLSLDADVTLTHPGLLGALLRQNRRVLAPLLTRPGQLWSNFWGALSPDGYYARSQDYVDIVQGKRRGVWNVPYVSHAYLVGGASLRGPLGEGPVFTHPRTDPDMAFCSRARQRGLFLHVTNREDFGHLLLTSGYNVTRRHPDLWQITTNPWDWEQQYLHPDYGRIFQDKLYQEPCPDVFQFPLFSQRLCRDLLEEATGYGSWSRGHLEGGSESVALALLGLEGPWLGALGRFLGPVATRIFPGYRSKGRAVLSAVVRYLPSPTPHDPSPTPHDPSPTPEPPTATVTVSLSLSHPQGGGWQFPRYGCRVPAPPPGWVLLHPGRLTHHPRGVPPRGPSPRYALLTLLDP